MSAALDRAALGAVIALAAACGAQPTGVECPQGASWNGAVCVMPILVECPAWAPFVPGRGCVASAPAQTPPASAPSVATVPASSVAATPAPSEAAMPAPVDSATSFYRDASNLSCGCAAGDLACSMKCSAARSGQAPPSLQSFDRRAAEMALSGAAASAKGCKQPSGPTGTGRVTVVFAPSGRATSVAVGPPFAGTPTGSCIAGQFKGVRVPPFSGVDVTAAKPITL